MTMQYGRMDANREDELVNLAEQLTELVRETLGDEGVVDAEYDFVMDLVLDGLTPPLKAVA